MKTNFTHVVLVRTILFVLILLYSLLVFGRGEHSPLGMFAKNGQKVDDKQIKKSFVVVNRN